jgi:hypothetical protein
MLRALSVLRAQRTTGGSLAHLPGGAAYVKPHPSGTRERPTGPKNARELVTARQTRGNG